MINHSLSNCGGKGLGFVQMNWVEGSSVWAFFFLCLNNINAPDLWLPEMSPFPFSIISWLFEWTFLIEHSVFLCTQKEQKTKSNLFNKKVKVSYNSSSPSDNLPPTRHIMHPGLYRTTTAWAKSVCAKTDFTTLMAQTHQHWNIWK